MLGFGCVVSSTEEFERWARPGIELAAGPDALIAVRTDQRCIFAAYNSILDELGARPGIEGVVLLHQDLEVVDRRFSEKLTTRLAEPGVAVVGVAGARGVPGINWWAGREVFGGYGWDWLLDPEREELFDPADFWYEQDTRVADVDVVDGMILAISPWAAHELRFDEQVAPGFHGYDLDICLEARRRGHRVVCDSIDVIHHNQADLPDRSEFVAAHVALATKWRL